MFGKKEPRTCDAGHPQEDSWEQCPFCEADRLAAAGASVVPEVEDGTTGAVLVSKKKGGVARKLAGWIVALDGNQEGEDFRLLTGRNVIGKGEMAEIRIRDARLSKRHAALEAHTDGRYEIRDLESKYGTFVNDEPAGEGRALADGDVIRLGTVRLKFKSFE